MPKPTISKKPACSTATATHIRRSLRLLGLDPRDPEPKSDQPSPSKRPLEKRTEPGQRSVICAIRASGLDQIPILTGKVTTFSGRRRSPRLSVLAAKKECIEERGKIRSEKGAGKANCNRLDNPKFSGVSTDAKRASKARVIVEAGAGSCSKVVELAGNEGLGECGGKDSAGDVCAKAGGVRVNRKRKKDEEGKEGSVQEWTREQEMALQRAYLLAKPTPHFWKKVSKLVPGKSAQQCYDKIHSESMTPPQPLPRSRAKNMNLSPIGSFSLSASKVLNISETNIKNLCHNKKKTCLAQKTVRQLLKKQNRMDRDHEADLFTVLEPDMNPSSQDAQMNAAVSTPKNSEKKQGFLQICSDKSSSGCKRPLSRFSNSEAVDLISPAVLKPVKNRALHEKYIDQLHSRELKRNAAYERSVKFVTGKENRQEFHTQKLDANAAKAALIFGARDVIDQLQHLQADSKDGFSDYEDDDNVDHDEIGSE